MILIEIIHREDVMGEILLLSQIHSKDLWIVITEKVTMLRAGLRLSNTKRVCLPGSAAILELQHNLNTYNNYVYTIHSKCVVIVIFLKASQDSFC